MLRKILLFTLLILTSVSGFSQATLYTEDFESLTPSWTATDDLTPNSWLIKDCAGNGPSMPGANAAYITKGGIVAGCGATGDSQFAYENAGAGTLMATYHTTVDGTCASSLQVTFDYLIDGVISQDFGELVYSTDGGTSWTAAGGELPQSSVWTTTTISLPALLDGTSFELGFRFTYDNTTITGVPLGVDNIVVTGTDVVNPIMTCPTSIDLPVDGTCTAICDDYTKSMLTLSDNCTDSINILVTQDIPEFTVFGSGPGGTETITLTAFDETGNSTQCAITLNVIDNMLPVITCPNDTNVYVDINCDGTIEDYAGDVVMSDNCSSLGNITLTQSPVFGTIINGSLVDTPVTMTATDEEGNSANCVFTARTIDTMVATIICPIDTAVYADISCQGLLEDYTGDAVVNDNCTPNSSLTVTQSPAPGSTITNDQVITLTVSGAIPNIDQQCTFSAIFNDTTAPTIVCPVPTDIYVDASCQALLLDYTGMAALTDNCTGAPIVTQLPASGMNLNVSDNNMVVMLTVTDDAGNTNQCQFNQPVFDTISPTISCPVNQDENADINCFSSLADYTAFPITGDNCSVLLTVTQSPAPATSITGTTQVTLTVEDEYTNTNSCVFDVNIIDVTAPTVMCPANTTVSTDIGCDYTLADFTAMSTASDNCTAAGSITYTQSPVAGTLLPLGLTTITINATDLAGNTGSCTFDITVEDQVSPTIVTCPSNQNIYANASCQGSLGDYTGAAVASDNCSLVGNLTISQSPVATTTISSTTPITITVVDENLNSNTCVLNAIFIDTISPVVVCPSDQTIAIDPSCQYIMPDLSGLVGGTDNCSALGNMIISQNPTAGSTETGMTAVLITLNDEGGNSATCIVNMIPDDNSAPTITCPTPSPVNLGSACDFNLANYGTLAAVLDNCNGYTIVQTPPAGTIVNPGAIDITLEVTDLGGSTDQCTFTLDVFESEDPIINCPSNISTCDPVVTYTSPTFSDNCLAAMNQTDLTGLSSGSTFPVGITTLEYTVMDSSGNNQMCSFDVEILDFPSSANITEDTIWLCDQNSSIVNADAITSGTGLWTVISGQGNFNNQFANSTGVNNIAVGINEYEWTVSSVACGTLSDTVVVINSQQDIEASTQDTIYSCTDATVILQSNTPLYGIGTWTTDGTGIIDNVNSSNTFSTFNNGWQEFVWTITSGSCPVTSDTLHVFGMVAPIINNNDTLVCLENDMLSLSGTFPSTEQNVIWEVISGSASIDSPYAESTDIDGFNLGNTLITYSLTHNQCATVSDTIIVTGELCDGFDPIIPTVITPGNLDGKNDVFTINFLNTVYPECHVFIFNRWGSLVFESIGYEEPWNGTYRGEDLPMGTYFYRIELNDGSGEVLKGDISIIH